MTSSPSGSDARTSVSCDVSSIGVCKSTMRPSTFTATTSPSIFPCEERSSRGVLFTATIYRDGPLLHHPRKISVPGPEREPEVRVAGRDVAGQAQPERRLAEHAPWIEHE